MRARSISYYAVEQKESRSIHGAASHIRKGLKNQKSAPKHPRSAFFSEVPVFLINRWSSRPALREVEVECARGPSPTTPLSKKKVDLSAAPAATSGRG